MLTALPFQGCVNHLDHQVINKHAITNIEFVCHGHLQHTGASFCKYSIINPFRASKFIYNFIIPDTAPLMLCPENSSVIITLPVVFLKNTYSTLRGSASKSLLSTIANKATEDIVSSVGYVNTNIQVKRDIWRLLGRDCLSQTSEGTVASRAVATTTQPPRERTVVHVV